LRFTALIRVAAFADVTERPTTGAAELDSLGRKVHALFGWTSRACGWEKVIDP
jgi:hypothetical protein